MLLLVGIGAASLHAQTPCEGLTDLRLENARVTAAVFKPASEIPPSKTPNPFAGAHLLDRCEVKGLATPTSDSEIGFELWLPTASNWNGKYMQMGNGGWVGDVAVNPGKYEYLFVVDGQWLPDPNAKESVQNPFGGVNSVLMVSS